MGGDRRLQIQQPHLHQAIDAAAESQGERDQAGGWLAPKRTRFGRDRWVPGLSSATLTPALPHCVGEAGFRGPGHRDAQLHTVFHERRLHGLRPGVQIQRGREGGGKRQRLRLMWGHDGPGEDPPVVQPPNPSRGSAYVVSLCLDSMYFGFGVFFFQGVDALYSVF